LRLSFDTPRDDVLASLTGVGPTDASRVALVDEELDEDDDPQAAATLMAPTSTNAQILAGRERNIDTSPHRLRWSCPLIYFPLWSASLFDSITRARCPET
jgi:hypothetical protein